MDYEVSLLKSIKHIELVLEFFFGCAVALFFLLDGHPKIATGVVIVNAVFYLISSVGNFLIFRDAKVEEEKVHGSN